MRCGDPFHHHGALFLMWNHGSFSWRSPGNGTFRCAYDPFHHWYSRYQNCVDLLDIPTAQKLVHLVYFLSCLLVHYHCAAGGLLCVCETDGAWAVEGYRESGVMERKEEKEEKRKRVWIKGV